MFAALLMRCSSQSDIAGSGTEAGNGRVVGRIITDAGAAAPNTALLLIPADFTSGIDNFEADTTNSSGHYTFDNASPGNYSIQGVQSDSRKRILILSVRVNADRTTDIAPDSIRNTGSLQITIPDSMRKAGGKLTLQGTTFSINTYGDSIVTIDSLPSGPMPPLVYLADSAAQPKTVFTDFTVHPGDTTVLSAISKKTVRIKPGDDLQAAVNSLLPGDSLLLAGGIYKNTGISIQSRGNPLQMITIAAEPGQTPVLRITVATNNCININGAEWLMIDGLSIDSTPPGVDGIKFTELGVSQNVRISNCTIHAVQGTGINAQGGHNGITIMFNHIYDISGDAVNGIRVAPSDSSSTPYFWNIANNWIHKCGDSLSSAACGISIKTGCHNMYVRYNTVYDIATSGIIVYGKGGDPETSSFNVITEVEGNAVWNASEGISAYCEVLVRNNVIFNCPRPVYSYSYNGVTPRKVLIINNTMYKGQAPYLSSWDSTNYCVFVNNAVYAMTGGFELMGNGYVADNAGDISVAGFIPGIASSDFNDPENRNFYPKAGSTLIGKATILSSILPDISYLKDLIDWDFNYRRRDTQPDIGAYEFTGDVNPGGEIKDGFKWK